MKNIITKPKIFYTLLATASLACVSPAFAEDNKQAIAVVNIQYVLKDSTAAKSVREQLDSKKKNFQTDITKKEEELQKEDKELGKQKSVLSKDAFEEKARAFARKATDVQKDVRSKNDLLNSASERSISDIQKVVTEIISELAKEKGFMVAIPTSQILYADNKLDISAEVLERLNKKLPKVDVKFDAPVADKKDSKK